MIVIAGYDSEGLDQWGDRNLVVNKCFYASVSVSFTIKIPLTVKCTQPGLFKSEFTV